jgi:hypothetical protein
VGVSQDNWVNDFDVSIAGFQHKFQGYYAIIPFLSNVLHFFFKVNNYKQDLFILKWYNSLMELSPS